MTTYRITRTIADGQFANDACFTAWLESFGPKGGGGAAYLVDMRIDPVSTLGPVNAATILEPSALALIAPPVYLAGKVIQAIGQKAADVPKAQERRYYLWAQEKTLTASDTAPLLKCKSDPDLIGSAGSKGWTTEAEARKVLEAQLVTSGAIVKSVKAANAKAVGAGNVAAGVLDDVAKDAKGVIDDAAKIPVVKVAVGVGIGVFALWVVSKIVGR